MRPRDSFNRGDVAVAHPVGACELPVKVEFLFVHGGLGIGGVSGPLQQICDGVLEIGEISAVSHVLTL
jgi:hypothetical protein